MRQIWMMVACMVLAALAGVLVGMTSAGSSERYPEWHLTPSPTSAILPLP